MPDDSADQNPKTTLPQLKVLAEDLKRLSADVQRLQADLREQLDRMSQIVSQIPPDSM